MYLEDKLPPGLNYRCVNPVDGMEIRANKISPMLYIVAFLENDQPFSTVAVCLRGVVVRSIDHAS